MSKTATVRARIEPDLKRQAEKILGEIGLKPSLAVQILYRCIVEDDGFPLALKRPNAASLAAMAEARDPSKLPPIKTIYDLLDENERQALADEDASTHKPVQEGASASRKARRAAGSSRSGRPAPRPRRTA
jgi:DNA-damage-inducible protein J